MADIFGNLMGGGHVAAQAGQRLAEGAHDEVYFIRQSDVVADAAALSAEDADAMSLVYHDGGVVLVLEAYYLGQVGQVAFH